MLAARTGRSQSGGRYFIRPLHRPTKSYTETRKNDLRSLLFSIGFGQGHRIANVGDSIIRARRKNGAGERRKTAETATENRGGGKDSGRSFGGSGWSQSAGRPAARNRNPSQR